MKPTLLSVVIGVLLLVAAVPAGADPVDTAPPEISFYTPAEGAHLPVSQWVRASYSCYDEYEGPIYGDGCTGAVADGAELDTSTPGAKSLTVTATDSAGNTSTATVHYTVDAFVAPPGPLIAYTTNEQSLYFASRDGSHETRVGVPGNLNGVDFSPDGTRFAYAIYRPTYDGVVTEIRTRAVDGTDDRLVLSRTGYTSGPVYSPDGSRLALTIQDPETQVQDVWVIGVDGTGLDRITHDPMAAGDADWSPDGTRLVYSRASHHAYGFDLAIVNVSTYAVTTLTDRPGNDVGARWSPDGDEIVFLTDPSVPSSNTNSLRAIAPDGTGEHGIAGPGTRYWGLEFSSDGSSLLLPVVVGDYSDLYRLDLATGTSTRITNTPLRSESSAVEQPFGGPPPDASAPTITVDAPLEGQTVLQGARVLASYHCADEPGGSGVATCDGTVPDGQPLDSATAGSHAFTVTTADAAGNTATRTVHYTVAGRAARQAITFHAIAARPVTDPDFDPEATATSGDPVTYRATPAEVCSIVAGKVHLVAVGTCTVTASQPGNAAYAAAPDLLRAFQVKAVVQSISFPAIAARTITAADFDPAATATSGLDVGYEASPSSVCTIVAGRVHLVGAGTCTVVAHQPGDATYAPAADRSRSFSVTLVKQSIWFAAIAARAATAPDFDPGATATSGLTVAYAAAPSSVCTIVGGLVHLLAPGTCTVTASQPGDDVFAAATPVARAFTVR